MIKKKPICPHCGQEMNMWATPTFNFSDGLGWGTDFLYVCFNDECPLYAEGWQNMMEHYGQVASYRCMCDPTSGRIECIPVLSPTALKGDIIDEVKEAEEKAQKEAEDKALADLHAYLKSKDMNTILKVLLNEKESVLIRKTAAGHLGKLGDLACIEPIRNHAFKDSEVLKSAEDAIEIIHKANYTKECPHCAEIIKARARVCKHCNRNLVE
jgi:hypothetical protein